VIKWNRKVADPEKNIWDEDYFTFLKVK